jgi:hypothetical protein
MEMQKRLVACELSMAPKTRALIRFVGTHLILDPLRICRANRCVQDCVKGGAPLVILTQDGRLYFPISAKMPDTGQRQELMAFVGKYVRARGIVFERTGTHAIVITEIKDMKEVPLTIDEE